MKIENMISNKGNSIPNQFIIEDVPPGTFPDGTEHKTGEMFQSYNSLIAFRERTGKVYLDKNYWDYSATTGKYRNNFLNEGIKETRKKIESGEYTLIDMN